MWQQFVWYLKSDWGDYMRTFAVTAAVVLVTVLPSQSSPSTQPLPNAPTSIGGVNHFHTWQWLLLACAAIYFVGSWKSITMEARRRKYDPALALKYTGMFFKDYEGERKKATKVLIRFHEGKTKKWEDVPDRSEIDPILDIFDDLGFLLQGGQISDWVIYQYFSYWIHLYYQAAQGYVELRRMEDNTQWEHVPNLYDDMMKIQEYKNAQPREKLIWTHDEMIKALKDEFPPHP
ncbi:MAG TPA: hypothetical protein VGN23_10050 [Verrucomicrobiae bacterium]